MSESLLSLLIYLYIYIFIKDERPLTCFNGDPVDTDLHNFSVHAKDNYNTYIEEYGNGTAYGKGNIKLQPIFVLPQDRDKYFDISK